MNLLRQALSDYLSMRRALGYKLKRDENLLIQFLTYLEELGQQRISTEVALAWATLPAGAHRSWWAGRLSIIRGFAAYLRTIDPETEVPSAELLPWRPCRATPYLYSAPEIGALLAATATLSTPHRIATYRTLIGLLVVTGMRVGEAIALDRSDFDATNGLLVVRKGKFGKSRELPLHPSTLDALRCYLHRSDRPCSTMSMPAMLVSSASTRLLYCNVQWTFSRLVQRAGLKPRSASCRPRLHDFRHSFAISTVLDSYRDGTDPATRLPLLSTYLGHVDPAKTYWYLSAAPELLALAGRRLEHHLGWWVMSTLAPTLQAFFTDRLIRQRQVSPNTVAAYRDTLRLLLGFATMRLRIEPSKLDIDHLEHQRGNSVRTRNARLAAPDRATWIGRRDHALIGLAAQTGLRASELIGLRCGDVHLGAGAHVSCLGKGRKQRITPLTKAIIATLNGWLAERAGQTTEPLFPTRNGRVLSRDALERRLGKHVAYAAHTYSCLAQKKITLHSLRHTAAMRLLQAGVDTSVIALWLGHEQVETTQVYLHADLAIKERALARTAPVNTAPGRYQPPDTLIAFLEAL